MKSLKAGPSVLPPFPAPSYNPMKKGPWLRQIYQKENVYLWQVKLKHEMDVYSVTQNLELCLKLNVIVSITADQRTNTLVQPRNIKVLLASFVS